MREKRSKAAHQAEKTADMERWLCGHLNSSRRNRRNHFENKKVRRDECHGASGWGSCGGPVREIKCGGRKSFLTAFSITVRRRFGAGLTGQPLRL